MNEESKGEIIIYRAEDGKTTLEVGLKGDTVWLDAHQMADLPTLMRSIVQYDVHCVWLA